MPFPFRMTFTGLCAFVPNTNGREGRVLLVDASVATGGRHAHVPWLRYQGHKYSLGGADVEIRLTNPQPATLNIFSPTLTPPPLPPAAHRPVPRTQEEQSVFWITDLATTGAVLKADCFNVTRPPFIAARIKLSAGHLGTTRVLEDKAHQGTVVTLAWALRNTAGSSAPGFHRVMASEFALNALIDAGQVVITSGSAVTTITLQDTAGEAVVEVGNTCDCVDTLGPLEDFGWFYELATAPSIFLPVRTGFGATDTMCPPAKFAPNGSA